MEHGHVMMHKQEVPTIAGKIENTWYEQGLVVPGLRVLGYNSI